MTTLPTEAVYESPTNPRKTYGEQRDFESSVAPLGICSYCHEPMIDPPEACPGQDDPGGPCAVVEGL